MPDELLTEPVRNSSVERMTQSRYTSELVHVLVVEDEPKLSKALQEGLQDEGYQVSVAGTAEEGFYLLHSDRFDLVVLDVMLPGRSGLEILGRIRQNGIHIPVLLLTARDSGDDRVTG